MCNDRPYYDKETVAGAVGPVVGPATVDALTALTGSQNKKRLLERPRKKWEDKNKMGFMEIRCEDGIG
jgi:hypothetical protein